MQGPQKRVTNGLACVLLELGGISRSDPCAPVPRKFQRLLPASLGKFQNIFEQRQLLRVRQIVEPILIFASCVIHRSSVYSKFFVSQNLLALDCEAIELHRHTTCMKIRGKCGELELFFFPHPPEDEKKKKKSKSNRYK